MWILEADRRVPGKLVWATVPITIIWTNLHGGVLAWVACVGIFLLDGAFELLLADFGARDWRVVKRHAILFAATAGATLANPYGWALHRHISSICALTLSGR
jgi:hypothetical protein